MKRDNFFNAIGLSMSTMRRMEPASAGPETRSAVFAGIEFCISFITPGKFEVHQSKEKNFAAMTRGAVLFLFIIALLCTFSHDSFAAVVISGKTSDLDLSGIIRPEKDDYSEPEVKQLCAGITERYHSLGYTAFYIEKAFIRTDGTLELVFHESRVERVTVTGAGKDQNDEISGNLYPQGYLFNEYLLKDNIRYIKDKYSLKKVAVDVERTESGGIELSVSVTKRMWGGAVEASSDPVYGALTSAGLRLIMESSGAGASFKSSLEQKRVRYNEAEINYSSGFAGSSGIFILKVNHSAREDALFPDGEMLYSEEITGGESGVLMREGAVTMKMVMLSSYVKCRDYPGTDGGISFSAAGLGVYYNDSEMRIDPSEIATAGCGIDGGWNAVENSPAFRLKFYGSYSFPLHSLISLTAGINSRYTSENERLFQEYVFDSLLPCRKEDYTSSSWRTVARLGFLFEAAEDTAYISPEYLHGFYDSEEQVSAAGLRIILRSESFSAEASFFAESGERVEDGVVMFSAKGTF